MTWASSSRRHQLMAANLDVSQDWMRYVLRWPTAASRDWAARAFAQLCSSPDILAVVVLGSTVRPAESSYDFDCLYIYQGGPADIPAAPNDVDVRGFDL